MVRTLFVAPLLALVLVPPASAQEQTTNPPVDRAAARKSQPGPAANFTGRVTVQPVTTPQDPSRVGTALVTFAPGARSNWHTHPAGQALYITEGCGLTQQDGGPVMRICKGDAAYVAAGVRHWHGATATTAMTHLAVNETVDGKNVDWAEPVSDAQYGAGRRAR